MPRRMRWVGALSVLVVALSAAPAHATYKYVTSWGGTGTAQNKFQFPVAMAFGDPADAVYTVDNERDRVQEWTAQGHFVRAWGSFGAQNGELNGPEDITVGIGVDNVYVADTGNDRVAEFGDDGGFIRNWGTTGTGNKQFEDPEGIAAGNNYPNDRVYVADTGNDRIQEFTYSGGFIRKFGSSHLDNPVDLAISPTSGNLYVGNLGNNRIAEFTKSGTFVRSWVVTGTLIPPRTLTVDSLGRVFVGDTHGIVVYGPKGAFITRWGDTGYGANNLFEVWGIAFDGAGDYVFVGDNQLGGTFGQQGIKKFQILYPGTSIVLGPQDGTTTADSTPTFAFTSSAQNATFQCRLDSQTLWSTCTSPHTTAPLADGSHTFRVRAVDSQGLPDISPSTRNFTVATTP